MAEHVPKAMLCGADLTAIDIPLMIALGARIYEEPEKLLIFPEGLGQDSAPQLSPSGSLTSWGPGIRRYWR